MNKTYQYPYITERYSNYMSYIHHHRMGEWYSCAVHSETAQSLKPTSTLPHPHQPAINPYDIPAESSHPPKSYPVKIKFKPPFRTKH
jgi:hypothetical protein